MARGFGARLLAVAVAYSAFTVIRSIVLVAEGSRHDAAFFPALALTCVFTVVAGRLGIRLWRGQRSYS
jgi:hypothetical protein